MSGIGLVCRMNTVRCIKLLLLVLSLLALIFTLWLAFVGGEFEAMHGFAAAWQLLVVQYYFCRFMGWRSYFTYIGVDADKNEHRLHIYDAVIAIGPALLVFLLSSNPV